ncbi:Protein disulfide-isomerase 1 [Diplonema papillatum]|nr:Protein disulfide-isomerase 1 [Diplonema papillatum]
MCAVLRAACAALLVASAGGAAAGAADEVPDVAAALRALGGGTNPLLLGVAAGEKEEPLALVRRLLDDAVAIGGELPFRAGWAAGAPAVAALAAVGVAPDAALGYRVVLFTTETDFAVWPVQDKPNGADLYKWAVSRTVRSQSASFLTDCDDGLFSTAVFMPSRAAVVLLDTDKRSYAADVLTEVAEAMSDQIPKEMVFVRATEELAPERFSSYAKPDETLPKIMFFGRRKGKYHPVTNGGAHTKNALIAWLQDLTGSAQIEKLKEAALPDLTSENFEPFLALVPDGVFAAFHAPWCGHCKRMAPTFQQLAEKLRNEKTMKTVRVDATAEKAIAQRYKVDGFPTLKWISRHGTATDYTGDRSLDDMLRFCYKQLGKPVPGEEPTDVVVLSDDTFDSVVTNSKQGVFVKFFAPWCGHCKAMAPDWDKLGTLYKADPDVVIAKYDGSRYTKASANLPVQGFPTILWFGPEDKAQPSRYGGARSFDALKGYVESRKKAMATAGPAGAPPATPPAAPAGAPALGKPGAVVELSAANFESATAAPGRSALVMFYAPWCGHCKRLMPDYEKFAASVADKFDTFLVAKYDAPKDPDIAKAAGVKSFPTIFFYGPKGKVKFEGDRSFDGLNSFVNERLK